MDSNGDGIFCYQRNFVCTHIAQTQRMLWMISSVARLSALWLTAPSKLGPNKLSGDTAGQGMSIPTGPPGGNTMVRYWP